MSRASTLSLFGVLVLLLPFAGLPSAWLRFFLAVLGVGVLIIGLSIRAESVRRSRAIFEENLPSPLEHVPPPTA